VIFKTVLFLIMLYSSSYSGHNSNGNLRLYYPIKEGLKWEYLVEENGKCFKQEVVCKVPDKGNDYYDFILETKSIRKTKYYYKIIDDIVYATKEDVVLNRLPFSIKIENNPAIPVFILRNDVNGIGEWKWKGKIKSFIFEKRLNVNFKIIGTEYIYTSLGKMECLKITAEYKYKDKEEMYVAWYAKNIGLVKMESNKHRKRIISINYINEES